MNVDTKGYKMKLSSRNVFRILRFVFVLILFQSNSYSQEPYRVGTTTANFLEIGYGSRGIAMGDAVVSNIDDISSLYWNPAGLARMQNNQAMFQIRPWLVDITVGMAAVGIRLENIGTLGIGITYADFGEMDVTTMEMQEGTGETFNALDFSLSLSYARNLAEWFAFGVTFKYISSRIWEVSASSMAFDLGVSLNTEFFSPTGSRSEGLKIGMSISNYGTKMQYDGINLLNPIDILPNEQGNYPNVEGQFKLREWEIPLIFRVGFSVTPIVTKNTRLTLAVDALHPNNNSESLNAGAEYLWDIETFGEIFLRGGYKGIFMNNTQYGLSLGAGIAMEVKGNVKIIIDYAYQDLGILGYANSFGVGISF
jgi:hypothetical protein